MELSKNKWPSYVRSLGDDDGTGQYFECNNLNVWLNCQGETMLYTGQLLLVKDDSKTAPKKPPSQRFPRHAQTPTSPTKEQNATACSKMFSALKVADIQFNSSSNTPTSTTITTTTNTAAEKTKTKTTESSDSTTTTTTAEKTKTKTTDSPDAATSTRAKALASKTLESKTSASKTLVSKTLASKTLASKTSASKISASNTQRASSPVFSFTNTSPASTTTGKNVSIFGANPEGGSSFTKSTIEATTSHQNEPKTTAAQSVTASGMLNNASPFVSWNTPSSEKKQGSPSMPLFPKASDRATLNPKRRSKKGNGASKYPFSSSQEDSEVNVPSDSKKNDTKIGATMEKMKSFEGIEMDVDSRGTKEMRKSQKEESSNFLPKELLNAQLQCFQIQHSLYRVIVAKLREKESKSELQSSSSSQLPRDTESEDLQSLLLPLETLLRCSDIQLGLHHSLNVALDSRAGRSQDDGEGTEYSCKDVGRMMYDKDELLIESRSLMNHTKFAQSLVCLHLFNPYSTSNLKYACGEDRIFSFQSLFWTSNYYVPHGDGKLVSLGGNLIYEGQWKKGKRWGHGKAFIFSGTELSASKNQYGMYEGQWWSNMRHGHGRQVFASCAVYEGEWQYDLMSGVGAMHSPDGSVLEGLWDEDEPSGCGMFTWPNGSVEYREYRNGQVVRVLQSPEETRKISPLNEVMREYSILRLKYQMLEEENERLVKSESRMKEQQTKVENDKKANRAQVKQLRGKFTEVFQKHKEKVLEKHQEDLQSINDRHDKKIKDLEDKIHHIEAELDGKKSDLLCQICFEHCRDCILMPCSHLLYCQMCIAKLPEKPARCPACRGSINSQIICNLTQ